MLAAKRNQVRDLQRDPPAPPRPRVLLIAHCFDAKFSMESRLSWFRATEAARQYDTTVVCAAPFADIRSDQGTKVPGLKVVTVAHTAFEKMLINTPFGFYLAYRLWHRRVARVVRGLHQRRRFALVHQVSYCGYREPGYCWQLGIPFVWGPIGGTQDVPWRFLNQFDVPGAVKEAWRTVVNRVQLRVGQRVGKALDAASVVYVANREIQESFRAARGVDLPVQLETGIHEIADAPSPLRDQNRPLRVLWVGRLENWKGLPLLLQAVAELPKDFPVEVRVVGSGSREQRCKRLAKRLGVDDRIEWIPLPQCGARDEHYRWADVFTFTSLRDTSGTGLLESLAAGVPIVGLNHQGARDIMSDECALPIAVETSQQVVADIVRTLQRLASDSELLQQLSHGAIDRAHRYQWDQLGAQMMQCYAEVLGEPQPTQFDFPPQRPVALQQAT